MSKQKKTSETKTTKKRGRPRKQLSREEIELLEEKKKNKLTLEQKQEIKLQLQKQKEAEKAANGKTQNEDRFYCNNNDLHSELLKWRNSDVNGIKIMKLIDDKLVQTESSDSAEQHETYEDGVRYFVKIPKNISKFKYKYVKTATIPEMYKNMELSQDELEKIAKETYFSNLHSQLKSDLSTSHDSSFYNETKDYITHEVTHKVRSEGWAFNYDLVCERTLSDKGGDMLLKIGNKMLNRSEFRNYKPELKEDMLMFGIQKIIKGIKNYNFKFSKPFAWFSMAFWNSYLTTIYRHYKQLNIRRDLMKKLAIELQTYNGIDSHSALNKAIKSYIGEEFNADD